MSPEKNHTTASRPHVALVMPALNEEPALARVFDELPRGLYAQIILADNGSTDHTAEIARARGATVVREPRRGYGAACLAALGALASDIELIVFMDADGSDVPAEAANLLEPILCGEADLVIGSRALGAKEPGALPRQQEFGNVVAVTFIRLLFGHRFTDLGPFRAVRRAALEKLEMKDMNFGWTVEMQLKALRRGLRVWEVPVSYRRRIGRSKISGTLRGALGAALKISWMILRLRVAG